MSPDWVFDLISAVQRFICDTADFDLAAAPEAARRLCQAIPPPQDLAANALLRSTLIEAALRWGHACHHAMRSRCLTPSCVPTALGSLGHHWSGSWDAPESDGALAKDAFVTWLNTFCREVERTHPDNLARRVAQIIVTNVTRPLRVDDIATQVGAHPSVIRRAFHREFHLSMRDYHRQARVEHAERLLRGTPRLKIEAIGLSLGWRSKKGVYGAIRQLRGCTPSALRRELKNEPL